MTPPGGAPSHDNDRTRAHVDRVLAHVVVAGGTPAEWLDMSARAWKSRLQALADGASAAGAHWVTLLPHHGEDFDDERMGEYRRLLEATGKVSVVDYGSRERYVWQIDSGLSVIVDPVADGHRRFAEVVEGLRVSGARADDIDEESLSVALLAPAAAEPDLVVVLGPPDLLPDSMVWELAYSELVFLDLAWGDFNATHLELAIDDFNRRHRRFGGLDS